MFQDEYNKIEITNDKQLLRSEFGKTQAFEFTSKKENTTPDGDMNEKYVGKTIKKVTEVNVDYVNKVPTHASQTVVTSSTTATSAGAAVASTVAAASTVAVVAIATATGISVALHDYHCELTSLLITSNEISYSFSIIDNKREDFEYQSYEEEPRGRVRDLGQRAGDEEPIGEDIPPEEYEYEEGSIFDRKRPFVLTVSNGTYECDHFLDYGNSEYNTFHDLTLGDTYSIVLKENRFGGETLFSESFTTAPNSGFRDFYMSGQADYRMGTFGVYLDYIDELECLSEFVVTLIDKENSQNTFDIPVENVPGYQDVSVRDIPQQTAEFDFEKEYSYIFSYKKSEDVIQFAKGDVTFYNTSPYVSQVFGVDWDHKANFLTNQATITLDFRDDYELFSDFRFVLMPEEQGATVGGDPLVYELAKTTEPQNVTLTENQNFSYLSTYSYMFTYMEDGKDVEQIIESDSGLRFEDNSGTEVSGVTWDKTINLLTKQFKVTLNYTDVENENEQRFSNFQLTLKDEERPEEMYDDPYDLEKTTEEQTVTIVEDSNLRLRRPLSYAFTYFDRLDNSIHTIEEGTVTFTDNSNGKKEFKGITINKTPDMVNSTIEVQLNYVDDFGELDGFTLNFYTDDIESPTTFHLSKTTDKQTIDVANNSLDFTEEYNYFLAYYDDATWEEVTPDAGKGTITFDHSVFNEFIFDYKANFDTRAFDVQLDFVDGLNIYSNFKLTITDDYDKSEEFTLEKTSQPQTLFLDQTDTYDDDGEEVEYYIYDIRGGMFTYSLTYHDSLLNEDVTINSEEAFRFTNTLQSTFTGINSPFDFTTEATGQSYLLPLQFEFNDAAQIYSYFEVQIWKNGQSVTSLRFEGDTVTDEWLYGVLVPDGMDINDLIGANDTRIVVIASLDTETNPWLDTSEEEVYNEPVVFTLDEHKEIYGGHIAGTTIMWGGDIVFQLVYSGQPEDYVDCELHLEAESGVTYRFAISQLSPGSNYCSIYMDSDNLGDYIDEATFVQDFLNYPMKVSIVYYKKVSSGGNTGGNTGGIRAGTQDDKDGPYTVVLHEQIRFEESV